MNFDNRRVLRKKGGITPPFLFYEKNEKSIVACTPLGAAPLSPQNLAALPWYREFATLNILDFASCVASLATVDDRT